MDRTEQKSGKVTTMALIKQAAIQLHIQAFLSISIGHAFWNLDMNTPYPDP